mmetsp:Transcript_107491/g.342687  ORF Transcript_107491/g.342687 Transcript_107491/m.342687 type:complete len:315 (-) Transcript_107491:114-1058(-)
MPLAAGLFFCAGAERKCNWLLVRHVPGSQRCVVFFPGDLSDFAAGGGLPYSYSLEALFWVLCRKYPDETLVLVKPHMMVDRFAIYVNFMLVDGQGNPRPLTQLKAQEAAGDGDVEGAGCVGAALAEDAAQPGVETPRAVLHLERLLDAVRSELGGDLPARLTLVGFSKGAVVLGAVMREARTEVAFWQKVDAVHFVDAGLTVPGNLFPVSAEDLQALKGAVGEEFVIWLHGTPRQWEDEQRPFVAEETLAFEQRCRAADVHVERRYYAAGQPPTLNQHFDAVRCFCTGDAARDEEEGGDRHLGFFAAWTEACSG